jgi:hypothetical protein
MRVAGCRMSENVSVRAISLNVTIDGIIVVGAIGVELFQSGMFSADRFILSMAFSGSAGASFYSQLSNALVSISAIVDNTIRASLIVGEIDNVTVEFSSGIARLSGRDLSARLIDAEVNESFANQTASDIAISFALAAGLSPNIVRTQTAIGQYYELAHTRTALGLHTRNATQWELLAALAEVEAFSLSVTGTTLNFAPASRPTAPVTLIYGQDLTALSVDRAVSLSNAKVTVKSWNTRLKVAHYGTQGSGISTTIIKPNLAAEQAVNIAMAKQAELVAQTTFLRAMMPGETSLLPQTWINLQGTNTNLDGLNNIQAIERNIDTHHGFSQVIEAYAVT